MSMTLAPTTTTSAKPRRIVAGAKAEIRARPTRATRAMVPGKAVCALRVVYG